MGDEDDDLYNIVKRQAPRLPPLYGPLVRPPSDSGDLNLGASGPAAQPPSDQGVEDPPRFRGMAASAPASVRQDAEAFASRHIDLLENPGGTYRKADLNNPTTLEVYKTARDHLRNMYLLGRLTPDQQITGPGGASMPASQMFQQLQGFKTRVGQSDGLRKTDKYLIEEEGLILPPEERNDPNRRGYYAAVTRQPITKKPTTDVYINPYHETTVNSLGRFPDPQIGLNWIVDHEYGGHGMLNSRKAGAGRPDREAIANSFGGGLARALGYSYPTDDELVGLGGTMNGPLRPRR